MSKFCSKCNNRASFLVIDCCGRRLFSRTRLKAEPQGAGFCNYSQSIVISFSSCLNLRSPVIRVALLCLARAAA